MAIFFEDNFNDTDGTTLNAHTPDLGDGWVTRATIGGFLEIRGNVLRGDGGLSDGALYTADVTYPSDDYDVTVDIVDADNGDDTFHVIARFTDNDNMLALRYNESVFALHKKVSGTWTTISNQGANAPVDGDTVGIRVVGNEAVVLKNGTEYGNYVTLDSVLETGIAGIAIGGGWINRVSTDDISVQEVGYFAIDNTGSSGHTIVPNDITLGLVADNDTITQNHVISPNDISLALTEDNTVVTESNAPPTVALNTPADSATGISTTPDLVFTGTDPNSDDVEYKLQVGTDTSFTSSGSIVDSYADTNQDAAWSLQTGFRKALGQSFTGDGSKLGAAKFYMRKAGSPTGTAYAKLYAHTGTFGADGTPTGTALATSEGFDVSTLTTSYVHYTINFNTNPTLTSSTKYFIVIDVDGIGDASNYIQVGADESSPSHGGNVAYFESSWTSDDTYDLVFEVLSMGTLLFQKLSVTPDATFSGTGDPHPWASGVQVTYTVQAGDELDNSTTYYWRVAATDPTGSNTYGAWSTTRSFTTEAGIINHTIAPNDISLALTEAVGSITQNHVIAVNDITLGLVADNAVIDQNHVIQTNDLSLGLTTDATTVEQTHIIASQDLSLGLQTDNTSITQGHVIATQDASIALTISSEAITQNHVIAVNDISLGIVADNTSITETQIIATQDISLALTTDATAIDQDHVIDTQDISLDLTTDNTALTQNHVIAPNDIALGLVADNTTITQNQVISPNDLSLPLTTDNTALTQDHVLAVNDITLGLVTDNATLTQNHVIATNDISLALTEDNATVQIEGDAHTVAPNDISLTPTIDSATIVQNHIISPNDITLGLLADNAVIEQNHVIASNDLSLTLTTDNTALTQAHVIAVNDISLPLVTDTSSLTQNHIIAPNDITLGLLTDNSVLNTDTIIAPDDLSIALTTDATTLTQNHIVAVNDVSFAFTLDQASITQEQTISPDDISIALTTSNSTIGEADVVIKPRGLVFGSTVPRVMFDDSGNAYYRLDSNILIKL